MNRQSSIKSSNTSTHIFMSLWALAFLAFGALSTSTVFAEAAATKTQSSTNSFDHSHQQWSQVLQDIVVFTPPSSRVNYPKLIKDPSSFNRYLQQLSQVSSQQFALFSSDQQLAFLINSYNAYQIKQVITNYPLKSIRDLGFLLYTPWKQEFFQLLGKDMSLDKLEHKLIRANFNEARIHFALNCASISCPPLMPQAFDAKLLEQQLQFAASNFINDSKLNKLGPVDKNANQTLTLSPIFDWYEKDFGKNRNHFILNLMTDVDLNKVDLQRLKVEYSPYNWNLNTVQN